MFVIHPKTAYAPRVDKDYAIVLQEYAILPNNTIPNSLSMEFNWLTFNGKAGPATTPLIVKLGERVRIRLVNIGMDHHPIHLHGAQFQVTGTEGGRIPEALWYPQNTVLVGVAQARVIEFNAKFPGDWILHCHLPHHMMNAMVSMVGPMAHGGGMRTGAGMEEGMGMMRGHALSRENGPAFGRGMGMAAEERPTSALVGQQRTNGHGAHAGHAANGKKRVPGFPQDMMMVMDDAVAKPETHGMAKGWSAAIQGMHTVVRVLPPDKYEDIVRRIRDAASAPPQAKPPAPAKGHQH
jgi:manganese oxidase